MANILTSLIDTQISHYPAEREAFSSPQPSGEWKSTSWTQFQDDVHGTASALIEAGVEPQQCIAIFSANRSEVLDVDFAAYAVRAIPVSIYSTSSAEQVQYIVNDCHARILFVGDEAQLAIATKIKPNCPTLNKIVLLAPELAEIVTNYPNAISFADFMNQGIACAEKCSAEVAKRTAEATPEDIATIIYTSGTTGEPKGAVLPHSCFNTQLAVHKEMLSWITDADTSLSFLPMSHIFEKAWTYFCLYRGIRVSVNIDPRAIQQSLIERRPSCMCSVPRFWEKVYTTIQGKLSTMRGPRKWVMMAALKTGRTRNLKYARTGRKAPWWLELAYKFYTHQVYTPLKRLIGVENGTLFPTAGAPIAAEIVEFFRAVDIPIVIGYGLSETTATVSCFPPIDYVIGTVGKPIPKVEVRIGEDNEIQVRGNIVMREYYGKPEETAKAFTADGWFRTGDAGRIDSDGSLVITERIKDLFKTSNGKYIAPQAIESRLGADPLIEQIAVIGDQRKFVSALIVPAYENLKRYAADHGIDYYSTDDLVKNERIRELYVDRLEKLQHDLASFERIKKFTLLPEEFTMEKGELTNTLKIKRPVINQRYAHLIDAMYE